MPKIIDDLEMRILEEARYQTLKFGYRHMTVRSVARACDIAVGTIYNYFPSKALMTACFMQQDWIPVEQEIQRLCAVSTSPMVVFEGVYCALEKFISDYRSLFEDKSAMQSASPMFRARHRELRHRLAGMIQNVCSTKANMDSDFLPEFIAEAFLAWSNEARSFDDLRPILELLFHYEQGENKG